MEIHIPSLVPSGIRSKVRRPVTAHCSSLPYTQSSEPPLGQQLLRKMRVFNASLWPHHEETTRERGGRGAIRQKGNRKMTGMKKNRYSVRRKQQNAFQNVFAKKFITFSASCSNWLKARQRKKAHT